MNCERCGKKLGTEVTDIHTCTPLDNWIDAVKYRGVVQQIEEIEINCDYVEFPFSFD